MHFQSYLIMYAIIEQHMPTVWVVKIIVIEVELYLAPQFEQGLVFKKQID